MNRRKKIVIIFAIVCALLLIAWALFWLFYLRFIAYTDDAYVEGNKVYITPLKRGFITAIHTDDTFLVHEGQLLVELDKTDALIALERAKKNLAAVVRDVCSMFIQVLVYRSEIEVRKAEYLRRALDYDHRKDVIAQGGVSLEDFEHSITFLSGSFYALQMTENLYAKAWAQVQGTTVESHPLVLKAADVLRNAWVQLYRCKIYSPVEGLAAQRRGQVGMWIDEGSPIMSVIPLNQIWVNANYKETQMKHMRIGQSVKVTSDIYGRDVVFHGTIVGLPGAAGDAFSLLPPQNLTGNWIKIVQRAPVRVALDPEELQRYPLRLGLSMHATADLKDQSGSLVPTSSFGAPLYQTAIFEREEWGDEVLISSIIQANTDPNLQFFESYDNPPYP